MNRMAFFAALLTMVSVPALADQPWYEGGTLQKAVVGDWIKATPENQLATSGDFIASLSAVTDISKVSVSEEKEIKKRAENLRTCVNETIKEAGAAHDKSVAELVVMCEILKHRK